jgi:seryl-tRNA synthetase
MHDIKAIRDNPQAFDAGLARRGLAPLSLSLLDLDQQKRSVQNTLQDMLSRRNALSKDVGEAMKKGETEKAEAIKAEVASLKDALAQNEDSERQLTITLNDALAAIPNIPLDEAPDGVDEHGNAALGQCS